MSLAFHTKTVRVSFLYHTVHSYDALGLVPCKVLRHVNCIAVLWYNRDDTIRFTEFTECTSCSQFLFLTYHNKIRKPTDVI